MQRFSLYPHYNEHLSLLALASILGTGTAFAVLLFRQGIEVAHIFFTDVIGAKGIIGNGLSSIGVNPELGLLFTLSLAGFLVGMIMHYTVGREKYHGVAAIMESVALSGGGYDIVLCHLKFSLLFYLSGQALLSDQKIQVYK